MTAEPNGEPVILIVEDNARNLKLVRDVLNHVGYRTLEAATAEDGLALAREERPGLVLMDIQLPGMDGVEALERLRSDPATAGVRVLALTAPDSDFELQLNAMAFVVERHARIRIGIDVNDTPLGAWERHPANADEPMRVHVPETVAKAGKLIVHLHIDKPAAPKQLGPSDDFRQLGVFLTSLDLLGSPSAEPASSSR